MKLLLSVKNLTVTAGAKALVHDVSFDVPRGKIVAIAGGSGSGKTTIGLSLMRLLSYGLSIRDGRIDFEGKNLRELSDEMMRQYRGARMGMVFQDPLSALDPLFTIGQQMDEVLAAHTCLPKNERKIRILKTFVDVELPEPLGAYQSFPHQLSAGMRQRAVMAQALVGGASLIIADEPTSNLDVTLQIRIMRLFKDIASKKNISILLISHDLGMIAHLADEVIILQEGSIVERGAPSQITNAPKHEYTKAFVDAFL